MDGPRLKFKPFATKGFVVGPGHQTQCVQFLNLMDHTKHSDAPRKVHNVFVKRFYHAKLQNLAVLPSYKSANGGTVMSTVV